MGKYVMLSVMLFSVVASGYVQAEGDAADSSSMPIDLNRRVLNDKAVTVRTGAVLPLSNVSIYAVYSASSGVEYFGAFDGVTRRQHRGTGEGGVIVVTREIGQGSAPQAVFNGQNLPPSANFRTDMICVRHSYYVSPCKSGETAVGEFRFWRVDSLNGGVFLYQNTSANTPHRTIRHTIWLH